MDKETKQLLKILSANIRRLRIEKGLSQEALAELAGLHRTYVGAVERAERNITLGTLAAFSHALGTTTPQLLTDRGK
jgi:transcriptional regulator with XRE-family HTH domain